jgi:WD40 repeat protein
MQHVGPIAGVAAHGRWLISASSDYSARIWSVPDLRLDAVLGGHGHNPRSATYAMRFRLAESVAE